MITPLPAPLGVSPSAYHLPAPLPLFPFPLFLFLLLSRPPTLRLQCRGLFVSHLPLPLCECIESS